MEEEEVGLGVGSWAWATVCSWARARASVGGSSRPATRRFSVAEEKVQQCSSDFLGNFFGDVLATF